MDNPPSSKYFWFSFWAMVTFGIVNGVFSYLNWTERAEMRLEQRMTRTMLDSRAKIQMTLIQAAAEGRGLTPGERSLIDRNWVEAEYPLAERPK